MSTPMNAIALKIFADAGGESHFEDMPIPLEDKGKFGLMSAPFANDGLIFREVGADYDSGWHCVPQPLFLVILEGTLNIRASNGEERNCGPGTVIYAVDTEGRGHRTTAANNQTVKSLLIKRQY